MSRRQATGPGVLISLRPGGSPDEGGFIQGVSLPVAPMKGRHAGVISGFCKRPRNASSPGPPSSEFLSPNSRLHIHETECLLPIHFYLEREAPQDPTSERGREYLFMPPTLGMGWGLQKPELLCVTVAFRLIYFSKARACWTIPV